MAHERLLDAFVVVLKLRRWAPKIAAKSDISVFSSAYESLVPAP